MQLKVIKADGGSEEYFHTKVVGTISNALARMDCLDILLAEQFAEVVTYYLYNKDHCHCINSGEIFSVIQAVLADTGYEDAAAQLSEYHFERKLRRSRTEVLPVEIRCLLDAQQLHETDLSKRVRWDKSRIADDLITEHGFDRQTARAIASSVEEKIFNMGIALVPTGLIKQLVLNDTATALRAQEQLQTV